MRPERQQKVGSMLVIDFYDEKAVADSSLGFAVIVAGHNGKWVFCRHKERRTYELPGGHREAGEAILETARRELHEETGAIDYDIRLVCAYTITSDTASSCGMLFAADIRRFESLPPDMEMAEIILCDDMPDQLTYPQIQPVLFAKATGKPVKM